MSPDTKKDIDAQDVIILLLLLPFIIIYDVWAWGITITHGYNWLVVPTYSVNPLTSKQAVAFAALWIIIHFNMSKNRGGPIEWSQLVTKALNPWIALLIVWFIKSVFI